MRIGILGINYKSSDLQLREKVARVCAHLFSNDSQVASRLYTVLLSTCNRTEIYFSSDDLAETHSELLNLLREQLPLNFEHKLYAYFGSECFAHLCRVTAGFDSAIVAETEIQRQVKTAYSNAACDHRLNSEMHFLFQKSLKVGKMIRSSYLPPGGAPTLEKLIYELSRKMLHTFSVFFVGNSEINRKMIAFFRARGIENMRLCTRGLHSAKDLAKEYHLELVDWNERATWQSSEVVICGSHFTNYAITPEQLQSACRNRVIFDLGLPRNVDPSLARHPGIRLFNIEELGNLIVAKQSIHFQGIQEAEQRLRKQMENQVALFLIRNRRVQGIWGRG